MMKRKAIAAFVVMTMSSLSWAAEAAARFEQQHSGLYQGGSQYVSIQGGVAIPSSVNDLSTSEKAGPVVGGQYLYQLNDDWAVGAQMNYFHLGGKNHGLGSSAGGGLEARSTDSATTLEFAARCNLTTTTRLVPYFHTGLGINYFHQVTDATPAAGSTWNDTNTAEERQVQDAKTVGFSYSAGFGVETNLTQNLMLGLEAAWQIFGVSKSTYGTNALGIPTAMLRLGWRFGRLAE